MLAQETGIDNYLITESLKIVEQSTWTLCVALLGLLP